MSFALMPVSSFETLFNAEELRAIAYDEFVRRHISAINIVTLQTGAPCQAINRGQWDEIVAMHLSRWGERDLEFHRPWMQGFSPPTRHGSQSNF